MGYFDLKVKCVVCDNEVGLNRNQLSKDVWICPTCLSKCGGLLQFSEIKKTSINDLRMRVNTIDNKNENKLMEIKEFSSSNKIGNLIWIDDVRKLIAIPQTKGILNEVVGVDIITFVDIVDFELLEDGNSITKGGLGRAAVGGLLFGGIGAVVGGVTGGKKTKEICTKLQIKITVNNLSNPSRYINLISTPIKTESIIYKMSYENAQKILSSLQIICNQLSGQGEKESNNNYSKVDEIKKYKELLDIGAITQEEFDIKKKELLK